ncbi:dolichyl-phosphate beta-glucosyltransferase [Rhizophlyctis rosea]|uniref:dolichyl-phosphate beta-glucosyltransferase n=1 Tax=Rhizophlyctis rosea TaxID=64517 RepID=A0AAD5X419_9FUNG|nr:dolichyl-phosphate beta-glucosyltransferase [Rhizophlyctis rosea]
MIATSTILFGVLGLALLGVTILSILLWATNPPKARLRTKNEEFYTHATTDKREPFPSLLDDSSTSKPSISISVIVPAYNETARLPAMLDEAHEYLDQRAAKDAAFAYEIIVVDDGSKDGTSKVALDIARNRAKTTKPAEWARKELRVLTLEKNRKKGGAVTQGMLVSRGEKLIFVDADGATKFSDIEKLEKDLDRVAKKGEGVAVGSRAHMVNTEAVVKRSFVRNFLMYGFHTILYILGISSIKDTQCGFKMVTRNAGRKIFPNMHTEGWIFDVEMLLLAMWAGVPIAETPVTWHEVPGTKMSLISDSVVMLLDLFRIRLNYILGIWKIATPRMKSN